VRTDAQGRFRWYLDSRRSLAGVSLRAVQLAVRDELTWTSTGDMARVELQHPPERGTLDLGDVVLREAPLLGAGTAVDDAGGLVREGLSVHSADEKEADPSTLPPSSTFGPGDRFEIRGWLAGKQLELEANAREWLAFTPIRFDRGAEDLRVVVRRKGRLAVTVLHDLPSEQADLLRTEVFAEGDTTPQRPSWSAGHRSPGEFHMVLSELAAGRYSLLVRMAGDTEPLARIDGIEVGAGAVHDARLTAIDIRGRVRLARLQVLDPQGMPARGDGNLLLDDADKNSIRWIQLHKGSIVVPAASHPPSGTLRVPGFREQRVTGIDGDRTVHLEPRIEVHARLAPGIELPAGVSLHAFAQARSAPVNPFAAMAREKRGPIVGSGEEAVTQPAPGRFTFSLATTGATEFTFVLARSDRSVSVPVRPAVVELAGRAQDVTFTVEESDVQAALRELQRD
jgi:hypothetical protein